MIRFLAHIPTPGGLTGGPKRLLTLASALKDRGVSVCVASHSDSELLHAAIKDGHEAATVNTPGVLTLRQGLLFRGSVWFRIKLAGDLIRQNWRLFCCIRRHRADVVRVVGSKGIAFGALAVVLSRRPLILELFWDRPSRGVVRHLHRFGLWAASAVIFEYVAAPREILGRKLVMRYRHKFLTITPGIDLAEIKPFVGMREQNRRRKKGGFVLLMVGTICARKNQMILIEALGQVRQIECDQTLRVWLAGSVSDEVYAENLRRAVKVHGLEGVVEFLGWRSDVHQLMVGADLLVMPSKDEGVPNTVQEAMAIGLPSAVSEAGGMPEIVRDGKTGWVIDSNRVTDWAERIQWCLDNPQDSEAVGHAAAMHAFEHFGMETWGTDYSSVVQKVREGRSINPR